jgi:hypothetical protein
MRGQKKTRRARRSARPVESGAWALMRAFTWGRMAHVQLLWQAGIKRRRRRRIASLCLGAL